MITFDPERIQGAFSSTYHCFVRYTRTDGEVTAFDLLKKELPHIDPDSWESRTAFGGIFINGIGFYTDTPLPERCKVEYYEPRFDIQKAHEQYPSFSEEWIVWEDHDLVICFKPAKLPAMPGKEQHAYNLKQYLQEYYKRTMHFPSRLDMSTQGLVIASKEERMHGPLQTLFEKRTITKEYLFATSTQPHFSQVSITVPLGKSSHHPVLREPHGAQAKDARTDFTLLNHIPMSATNSQEKFFIHAKPHTGRTHQIRVHAAHSGVPIIGDNFYGGAHGTPLHLLSFRIAFCHPFSGKTIKITLPNELVPSWAVECSVFTPSQL